LKIHLLFASNTFSILLFCLFCVLFYVFLTRFCFVCEFYEIPGFALVTEVQLLKNMRKDRIESAPVVESEESVNRHYI